MNDPKTHCPRCNLEYNWKPELLDMYSECVSVDCTFRYYRTDILAYQLRLEEDDTLYSIVWAPDDKMQVNVYKWYTLTRAKESTIRFEGWLPFDITLDTLKVWLAFS